MTKRRRLLVFIIAGALVLIGGLVIFVVKFGGELTAVKEKDAAAFGDNALADISVEWSPEVLNSFASAELLTDRQDEVRKERMAKLRTDLGKYESGDGIVINLRAVKDLGGDDALVGDYVNKAKFAKGTALVEMKLMLRKVGDWQIVTFKITKDP